MKSEIIQRQERAQSLMSNKGLSGLVLATPENIQYFTGVTEPSIHTCGKVIFASQAQPVLAVLWLDQDAAQEQAKETRVEAYTPATQRKVITEILEQLGGIKGTTGMDSRALAVLGNSAHGFLPNMELVNISTAIEQLRAVKSEEEIRFIQKACEIAEEGLKTAAESLKPGMTELQIAALAEYRMMTLGSDKLKHTTGVASGSRVRLPHAFATQKKIENGDIVVIDLGAVYHGYCSDIARTFVVGRADEELKNAFDVFRSAQETVLRKLCPGVSMPELQTEVEEYLKTAGYSIISYVGHSIGLQVEEHPFLTGTVTSDLDSKIENNMVLAFFQGSIKREGILNLGIRLEDTVVVTKSGAKMLTTYPRKL